MARAEQKSIAVVGAGISGLVFAALQARRGKTVTVFERSSKLAGLGAGLTLWPNATRVLNQVGILKNCEAVGGPLNKMHLHLSSGQILMTIPTENFSTPAFAMHRGVLHGELLKKIANTEIHTGVEAAAVGEDSSGAYVCAKDGRVFGPYSAIVGADGIRSAVRRHVLGELELRHRGYRVWRGISRPVRAPWPVGTFSETWGRGRRFGILPMGRGEICWYATENINQNSLLKKPIGKVDREAFSNWHKPIAEVLAATEECDIVASEAWDVPLAKPWSRGRVVLIGDAVHPMTPNLGMGGCMAIEDALVLSDLIASHRSPVDAFAPFEKLRAGRVYSTARRARFLGALGQFENPLLVPIRNLVAGFVPGTLFTLTSRSLHGYQADMKAQSLKAAQNIATAVTVSK